MEPVQHHRKAPPPPSGFAPPQSPPVNNYQPAYQQPVLYQQTQPTYQQPAVNYQPQSVYQQQPVNFQQPQPVYQQPAVNYQPQSAPPPVNRSSQPSLQPTYQTQPQPIYQQPQQTPPTQPAYSPNTSQKSQKSGGWLSTVSSWVGIKEKDNRNELFTAPQPEPQPQIVSSNAYDPKWNQMRNDSNLQTQHYQNLKVDNSSATLALEKLNQATDLGLATLEELEKQAENIDKIEKDVEKIHLQLDRGDRQLKSISGLSGAALNLVTNDKKAEKQSNIVYAANANQKDRGIQIQTHHAITPKVQNTVVSKYSHLPEDLRLQMEEQDRQLEMMSKGLGNLQNIAGTMGTELERQNAQVAKINYRVDQATDRTHQSNYKMGTMM